MLLLLQQQQLLLLLLLLLRRRRPCCHDRHVGWSVRIAGFSYFSYQLMIFRSKAKMQTKNAGRDGARVDQRGGEGAGVQRGEPDR